MRIFKAKRFNQWVASEEMPDDHLMKMVREIEAGLVDANLDGGLYKKRVAAKGRGKRSGYRTLLAFRFAHRIIFLYGFAKNELENIGLKEREVFRKLAEYYLHIDDGRLEALIKNGELIEIKLLRSLDYEHEQEGQEQKNELIGSRPRNGAGVV
jgi:hypothetical protein